MDASFQSTQKSTFTRSFGVHFLTQESVRLVKVACAAAGDGHSTVTDVADAAAAPHLRLFQLTGRVAVNANSTLLYSMYTPTALSLNETFALQILCREFRPVSGDSPIQMKYRLCCLQSVENDSKSVRETSRL